MKKFNFDLVLERDLSELLENFVANSNYNVIEHDGILYLQDLDTPHKSFEVTHVVDVLDKAIDMYVTDIPNYSGTQQEHHIRLITELKYNRCVLFGKFEQ